MTQPAQDSARGLRQTVDGVVTSTKMTKTITVQVRRTYKHPKYKKYVRETRKVHAHDEGGLAKVGDRVELAATRPLSKLKRWRLVRVVEAALDRGVPESALLEPDFSSPPAGGGS
jgi:small subunit ribosomal protein S17